jgi:hypothetical protein
MGGGCADSIESVWDDMDVSGENEGGAMLLWSVSWAEKRRTGKLARTLRCDEKLFGGAALPRFQLARVAR